MQGNYQNYPPAPPAYTYPYPGQHPPVVIMHPPNKDVQHGCHCLLWLLTGGLWTPCWIAACCGCGKYFTTFLY